MTETIKALGQSLPSANILTTVYTAPAGTSTVISTLTVCNQGAVPGTFRLSLAIAGASDSSSQYLYYDQTIPAKQTFVITLGLTMSATDALRFASNNGQMSINVSGVEST